MPIYKLGNKDVTQQSIKVDKMRVQDLPIASQSLSVPHPQKAQHRGSEKAPVKLKNNTPKSPKATPSKEKPDEKPIKAKHENSSHEGEDRLELRGLENAEARILMVYDRLAHKESHSEMKPAARDRLSSVAEKLSDRVSEDSHSHANSIRDSKKQAEKNETSQKKSREAAASALEDATSVAESPSEELAEGATQAKEEAREHVEEQAKQAMEFRASLQDRIEDHLKENNLNQYGDPVGTIYTGGTPLFNEGSGEIRSRMEYLLEKFPELTAA
ncbi:hypothetical protein HOF92_13185 [bacterium]|jgi:hypothetical protein|nr:hypothetical protein [bacterium]